MQDYPFNQDDWPAPEEESRGSSVCVMAITDDVKKPFIAWFNFNSMLWYNNKGEVASQGLKWRELSIFDKH